jgi:hypothetical protein
VCPFQLDRVHPQAVVRQAAGYGEDIRVSLGLAVVRRDSRLAPAG